MTRVLTALKTAILGTVILLVKTSGYCQEHWFVISSTAYFSQNNIQADYVVGETIISFQSNPTVLVSPGFLQYFPNDPVITIEDKEFEIYEFITPNDDGKNDYFFVRNIEKYGSNTLLIFNKYGSIVFSKDNYKNDWSPQELSDGSYFYQLKLTERGETKTGGITILR